MTQLDLGRQISQIVQRASTAPNTLPGGSLAAPGVTPVADAGAQTRHQQIQGILSGIAGAAQAFGAVKAEEDRKAAIYDRGAGARNARIEFGTLDEEITTGEFVLPDGMTPEDYVAGRIDNATAGMSQAYKERFESTFFDRAANRVRQFQTDARDAATTKNAQYAADAIYSAQAPGEIGQTVSTFREQHPHVSEIDAKSMLLLPALKTAAQQGDSGRFEEIQGELGDLFQTEQHAYRSTLEKAVASRTRDAQTAAQERLSQMAIDGATLEQRRSYVSDSELPASIKEVELARLDREEQRLRSEAEADFEDSVRIKVLTGDYPIDGSGAPSPSLMVDEITRAATRGDLSPETATSQINEVRKKARNDVIGAVSERLVEAYAIGELDAAYLPDNVDIPIGDGETRSFPIKEPVEEKRVSIWTEAAETRFPDDPAAQTRYIASQAGAVMQIIKPWRNEIQAIPSRIGPEEVPSRALEAFELYRNVATAAPEYARELAGDERTRAYLQLAEQFLARDGDPEAALRNAARVRSREEIEGFNPPKIKTDDVVEVLSKERGNFFTGDLDVFNVFDGNDPYSDLSGRFFPDVTRIVERDANLIARQGLATAEEAIAMAARNFATDYKLVPQPGGGRYPFKVVDSGLTPVTRNRLKGVVGTLTREYLNSDLNIEGLAEDDVILQFDERRRVYVITDELGRVVTDSPAYTAQDLNRTAAELDARAKGGIVESQNQRVIDSAFRQRQGLTLIESAGRSLDRWAELERRDFGPKL